MKNNNNKGLHLVVQLNKNQSEMCFSGTQMIQSPALWSAIIFPEKANLGREQQPQQQQKLHPSDLPGTASNVFDGSRKHFLYISHLANARRDKARQDRDRFAPRFSRC